MHGPAFQASLLNRGTPVLEVKIHTQIADAGLNTARKAIVKMLSVHRGGSQQDELAGVRLEAPHSELVDHGVGDVPEHLGDAAGGAYRERHQVVNKAARTVSSHTARCPKAGGGVRLP